MYHLFKGLYLYATSKEGPPTPFPLPIFLPPIPSSPTHPHHRRILHPPPRPRQRRQNHPPRADPRHPQQHAPSQLKNRPHSRPERRHRLAAGPLPQDLGRRRPARAARPVAELLRQLPRHRVRDRQLGCRGRGHRGAGERGAEWKWWWCRGSRRGRGAGAVGGVQDGAGGCAAE